MAEHDPKIKADLDEYIAMKTGGVKVGDKGKDGEKDPKDKPKEEKKPPPTTDKPKAATPPAKTNRIPLPDYNDSQSRLKYVDAVVKKHDLPHDYGDVFTRINEVPDTQTDTLPTKALIAKTAGGSGLPASLFYSSAMVEGMSGLYPQKGTVDFSGNDKFPVDGYVNFGLDTFSDAFPGLVKKGYLPADFNKEFVKSKQVNEQKQSVNSANFTTAKAALQAKAAMIKDSQDQVQAYTNKNKIQLSDKAKQFITLAYYNGGAGAGKALLQDFQREGLLSNDAFLKTKPKQSKFGKVYDNVKERFQLADALDSEQYKFDDQTETTQ